MSINATTVIKIAAKSFSVTDVGTTIFTIESAMTNQSLEHFWSTRQSK